MTPEQIKRLRNLLDSAAPRPWYVDHYGPNDDWVRDVVGNPVVHQGANQRNSGIDAALIVAAVNALPELLELFEALTENKEAIKRGLL